MYSFITGEKALTKDKENDFDSCTFKTLLIEVFLYLFFWFFPSCEITMRKVLQSIFVSFILISVSRNSLVLLNHVNT